MGYQVTARKWRPQTFDDVVEQHHVTRTLRNAIRLGRIAHAYLFAGTRGAGKTTMARVLAKALNCERVSLTGLIAQLEHITQGESIRISRTCLMRIAKAAEGSMRDAQSLLDQVVAYCSMEVRDEDVDQLLGYVGIETLAQCLGALL